MYGRALRLWHSCERHDFLLLARSEEEAPPLHYRFLNRRVDLPLHPSWSEWLWDRGLASGETHSLHSAGVHAYRCRPDVRQLEEDISAAMRRGRLTVPDEDELADAA